MNRLGAASDADYFIYTSVDIAVMPYFYDAINDLISDDYDAFSVTRRTISAEYSRVTEISSMYAQVGAPHPGTDCFVFRRDLLPKLFFANACVGARWIAKNFQLNLICNADRYRKFTDQHLTFHLGDSREWSQPSLDDYSEYNKAQLAKVISHYESLKSVPDSQGFYRRLVRHLHDEEIESRFGHAPLRRLLVLALDRLKYRVA